MKTRALLLALPLLALAACVDNRASLQIQGICSPTDDCSFSEKCDAQFLGFPTLDVTASTLDRLWLILQIQNTLPNNENLGTGRVNTNNQHVDEIVVEYEGIDLPRQVMETQVQAPANGTTLISVEVIPDALNAGATLAAFAPTANPRQLVANVRLRGYLDDGSRFETGDYPIAVQICSGCVTATNGLCPTAFTCPPASNGQLPVTCQ